MSSKIRFFQKVISILRFEVANMRGKKREMMMIENKELPAKEKKKGEEYIPVVYG